MVNVLLLILKIIGIILLALLGLISLLLLWPFAYKIKGDVQSKNYNVSVRVSWLLYLIFFRFVYNNEKMEYKLRVLGIPVVNSNKLENKRKNKETQKDKDINKEKKQNDDRDKQKEDAENQNDNSSQMSNEGIDKSDVDSKKLSFSEKVQYFWDKIKVFFEKIKEGKDKVVDSIDKAAKKYKDTKKFIKAKSTKRAYRLAKKIIIKVIKHIFPKKIKGYVKFGFETPDETGKMLGYIAIFYAATGIDRTKIKLDPDFQNKVFEGKLLLKGRVYGIVMLYYFIKFYFNKDIHRVMDKFK